MPASDIVAGFVGGLGGAVEGYGWLQEMKRKQQEEEARMAEAHARRQMEETRLRIQQEQGERAERQALRGQVGEELQQRIPDTPVSPEDAARIREAGFGYRLGEERRPTTPGLQPIPVPLKPGAAPMGETTETTVKPTVEQFLAQEKERHTQQQAQEEQRRLDEYISSQPEHVRQQLEAGRATGKMPTLGGEDFIPPEEQEQQARAAEQRRADLQVETHGRTKAIDERYRQREGGTATAAADTALVEAVMANPETYKSLTPTVQSRIIPALNAQGFKFSEAQKLTPSIQAAIKNLKGAVQQLKSRDAEMTQREGIPGKIAGRAQASWAWLTGTDEGATTYAAIGDTLIPALARASGEVGNLAEKEQERYRALVPRVSDPVNIRRAKMQAIEERIRMVEAGVSGDELIAAQDAFEQQIGARSGSTPARGPTADPLGIR